MRYFLSLLCILTASLGSQTANANTPPAIEKYGVPLVRGMAISPDGKKLAFIQKEGEKEYLVVTNAETGENSGLDVSNVKPWSVRFIDDENVSLFATETNDKLLFFDKLEYGATFAYNIKTKKLHQLLQKERSLFTGAGVGQFVGLNNSNEVLIPALTGDRYKAGKIFYQPDYNLFAVNHVTGKSREYAKGLPRTKGWLVNSEDNIIVRIDYSSSENEFSILRKKKNGWDKIYSQKNVSEPPFWPTGFKSDGTGLIIVDELEDGSGEALYELSWEGEILASVLVKENAEIAQVITNRNKQVSGVRYTGMRPSYEFIEPKKNELIQKIADQFPLLSIEFISASDKWKKIIFKISGGSETGSYYLFNTETNQMDIIAEARNISKEWVAPTATIEYKARDGVSIPALLTLPPKTEIHKNLPTIILPHGGPESYDQLRFDWWAQHLASRGYLVLQPNFRGSGGFGKNYSDMGYKQWGGLMQDDVTDGLKALVDGGYTDPNRVCIVGGSYGGYASLIGGALTPELYKCVVAFAPVTDLIEFQKFVRERSGRESSSLEYWEKSMGTDKKLLNAKSPSKLASNFKAPVLLIHGKDDVIVPFEQSKIMHTALKKAGVNSTFIEQKTGDHWLSKDETRIETLKVMEEFLKEHNPAH